MSSPKKPIQLLLVEDSPNEAERIANLFRAQGRSTRVQRVDSPEELEEALKQRWDLLICAPFCKKLAAAEAGQLLRERSRDIPLIQLLEDNNATAIIDALEQGASAALPSNEDRRLLLVAQRELAHLEDRRALHAAQEAQREAEKRCQLLLESSVDAIAYVHEGMHIYANQTWRQRFGYDNSEELESLSLLDLIAASDQSILKNFFKKNKAKQEANTELQLTAITRDGKQFTANLEFSLASYQGEPCTQVIIRSGAGNAVLEEKLREISRRDAITGLYNHAHFLHLLNEAATKAETNSIPAVVAYLHIDHYSNLLTNIGLSGMERLVRALGELLRSHFSEDVQLARFSDNAFSFLQCGVPVEQVEKSLHLLLKEVSSRLIDIGGRTLQTSLSIGVAMLEQGSSNASAVIERARHCATSLIVNGNALKRFDPAEELAARASSGDVIALLQQALTTDGFRLLFQPVVSLHGATEKHYEVLLRLKNSQDGKEIAPSAFLEIAGQAGLLAKIDRWVILNAIKRQRINKDLPCLFIHLSSASLQDETLLPWIGNVIKAAKLPQERLIFQFSAKDAEHWVKQSKNLILGLRALHCKSALSQFDGNARQFALLNHLDCDFIKLDSSQSQYLDEEENQKNLKNLLSELSAQNKQTIVPFVESVGVLSLLWQAGAHYIQGYYLQAPDDSMSYDFSMVA